MIPVQSVLPVIPSNYAVGGDLSGTLPNPSVIAVNGGAFPTSATVVGTNSSKQLVSVTTTGSGSVVLSASPTLTGTLTVATLAPTTISGTPSFSGVPSFSASGFALSGATTAGHYLRNNGTDFVDSAIQAADVPTLNQNTSGTAGGLSGTPAITVAGINCSSVVNTGTESVGGLLTAKANIQVGLNGTLGGQITLEGATSGGCTITAPAVAGTVANPIVLSNALQIFSVLSINGSTSGTSTITAPAIAGTNANPIVFSNAISVPNGSVSTGGNVVPSSAGAANIGTAALPWANVFIGGAATNNAKLTCTATAARTITFPDASINFSTAATAGPFTTISSITTANGVVTALSGSSDTRLKKSQKAYKGGLREIQKIHPVKYRWNKKGQKHTGLPGDLTFVGFIAQDVRSAIPEAITATEGREKYLSLDDRPIIAALVNAVKELAEANADLRKRLEKSGL